MKSRTAVGIGVFILALVAASIVSVYAAQAPSSHGPGASGQPWWAEGLTQQQVLEIKQKIWALRQQAAQQGWTDEQLTLAIHNLLAQYGIEATGPYFVDANGDGVCDYFGQGRGPMGQHRGNMNCTLCPWR